EFIFLTLTSPNVTEENLHSEIDRFNKAIKKLFSRKKVKENIQGYVRKLEVTTDQEKYITDELFSRKKNYFEKRGLAVGDANPQYNTYNPHVHIILSVKKSYFNGKNFIAQSEWLEMWRSCMQDERITQVDVRKVRKGRKSIEGAILEVAKYTAKSSDLYHSERVFDTYYGALKGRQLLVYSGTFKDYAKKYENGLLDEFKYKDENLYTHLLRSVWQSSNYENTIRELTLEEFEKYNERALYIEENNDVE
ncbi:protein rep, partial [Escherichia coli]